MNKKLSCRREIARLIKISLSQSSSFEMVPLESLDTISYSHFIVTMAVSLAVSEIFSVKEGRDLGIWVWGRSRSLKMAPCTRPCTTFYGWPLLT